VDTVSQNVQRQAQGGFRNLENLNLNFKNISTKLHFYFCVFSEYNFCCWCVSRQAFNRHTEPYDASIDLHRSTHFFE
jgi:hypothetical protein